MKTKQMFLLTLLLLGVLLGREAQAFYNPSTGRWLNRDPIEESGGDNLHSFVRNEPVSFTDLIGLSGFYLEHQQNGTFSWTTREVGPSPEVATGLAEIKRWDVKASVVPCNDENPKGAEMLMTCSWKVRSTGDGEAFFSYVPNPNRPERFEHELNHVRVYVSWWDTLGSLVQSYSQVCMCRKKAKCYQSATGPLAAAYRKKAELESLRWDVTDYGRRDARGWIRANEASIDAELAAAEAAVEKCRQTKCP